MNIASFIDHTLLSPIATIQEIVSLCEEAVQYQFYSVCVPPYFVDMAKKRLLNTSVKVSTVIGFDKGYSHFEAKTLEIIKAIDDGVDELDMVANTLAIKNNNWDYLEKEISQCIIPVKEQHKVIKIIIESGALTDQEIMESCTLYKKYLVHYLKTSTGYSSKGASVKDVNLIRKYINPDQKIKASGGIRNLAFALELINAGAMRLGTSSGVAIIEEAKLNSQN